MDKKDTLKVMYSSGREAEMYRKIDRFFRISWRFGGLGVWTKALLFAAPFIIISVILLIYIFTEKIGGWALAAVVLLILAGVGSGFAIIYALTHLSRHEYDHIKALIENDGIEKVYDDLINAKKIKGSRIYAGSTYFFGRGADLCRIGDIEEVYLHSERSYYCVNVRAMDEFSGTALTFCTVYELTDKSRYAKVNKVREVIMAIKDQR